MRILVQHSTHSYSTKQQSNEIKIGRTVRRPVLPDTAMLEHAFERVFPVRCPLSTLFKKMYTVYSVSVSIQYILLTQYSIR